jgi:16S rRNA (adenine1518-N6/adenine1519-N6)-dimethyltransferase
MSTRVAVVDDRDRFLRWEERAVVHREQLLHRSVHVLVFTSARPNADAPPPRLVIQKRHQDKLTFAGHWDVSCSGHVDEEDYPRGPDDELDRVYAVCARREIEEELGIAPELTFVGHFGPVPGVHYEQIHLYRGTSDGPFVPQAEEIEELRSVTRTELEGLLAREPHTATLAIFARLAHSRGWW